MKFHQPIGADEGAEYVDGNETTGEEGSPVPAAAIEAPQREIVHVIEEAGLEPDGENNTQLHQAILSLIAASIVPGGDMFKADNLNGLTNLVTTLTNLGIFQNRGTDVASAATTPLGAADSFFVRVTGNAAITGLGNGTARKWCFIEFTGTPLLTHGAVLVLPRAANIQVEAGDTALFIKTGASSWHCVFFQRKSGQALEPMPGTIVQTVHAFNSSNLSATGSIPLDNTTPESTEGTSVLSQAITPKYANSKLHIRAILFLGSPTNNNNHGAIALFSGNTNIGAGLIHGEQSGVDFTTTIIEAVVDAVDITSRVISVRIGRTSSSFVLNADGSGNAVFNGQSKSVLTIQEIKQ